MESVSNETLVVSNLAKNTMQNISVKDLFEYIKKISSIEYSNSNPIITVLKKVINQYGLNQEETANIIFSESIVEYEKKISDIFKNEKKETKKKYTKIALKIYDYFNGFSMSRSLPDDFSEALQKVFINSGMTPSQIEKLSGLKKGSARSILNGRYTPCNSKIIAKLEKVFGLPLHTLASKLPHEFLDEKITTKDIPPKYIAKKDLLLPYLIDLNFDFKQADPEKKEEACDWILNNIAIGNNEYSKSCKNNLQNKYRYTSLEKSPILLEEISNLSKFKESIIPGIEYKKISSWNESSTKKNIYAILYFIGYVDKYIFDKKFRDSDYSILILLNQNFVHKYIQYRVSKRNKISSDDIYFLMIAKSLLNDKYGFISQTKYYNQEDFVSKLMKLGIIDKQESELSNEDLWGKICKSSYNYYSHLLSELKHSYRHNQMNEFGDIDKSRDPFIAIEAILNTDEPIYSYLNLLINARNRFIHVSSNLTRTYSFLKAYISLMIILQTALRSKNVRNLVYSELQEKNKGTLYFKDDKFYVNIPAQIVKNKQRITREILNTNNLYDDIRLLLSIKDKINKSKSDLLFMTINERMYTEESFSKMIRDFIKKHIAYNKYGKDIRMEGLQPHGPHALRDIIATHYIKKTGSFAFAALAIDDTEQTVKNHYARFLPIDKYSLIKDVVANIF